MKTMKYFIVMLLSISLCMPLTYAQPAPGKQQEAQATSTIAQDVLIIIQQEQVRFTAQRAVEEMRLQVFDQGGQLVYDSGAMTGPELTWVLRQADGEAVKSGLYAYTLSVKETGAADARVRRGHFIVDRARERDGKTDRIWVTIQNDSGVGTELTVARDEGGAVAGTSVTVEQKGVGAGFVAARDGDAESKNDNNAVATPAAANGTTGRIAKFVSATDLGDSIITELNGNVGIGTTNPTSRLEIAAQDGLAISGFQPFLTLRDNNFFGFRIRIQSANGGIFFQTNDQTVIGGASMHIQNGSHNIGIGTALPQAKLDVIGTTRTTSLQITGGADFAENFEVNIEKANNDTATAEVQPGMVVSIDPANPGKLQLSARGYDRRVAGIVSGAGGVKPGMVMSQESTLANGEHPVALSGRVYCWVDASLSAIKPGDLLTTSSTPGHAMKAANAAKAQGAIIGKAMTGLKSGKGLVLVLVTLQ